MKPTSIQNHSVAKWLHEHYLDLMSFYDAYERLAEQGKADAPGGAEYHDKLAEWISEGCPEDIESYIQFALDRDMSLVFNYAFCGRQQ
jgi:hypothetical protein